jgi:hypothetical protein
MQSGEIDLGKPVERKSDAEKRRRKIHRPLRGTWTFFIFILTFIFVGMVSHASTRRYTWIVLLPIYGVSLLIYIAYLCYWHNDDEEEELLPPHIKDIIHEHDFNVVMDDDGKLHKDTTSESSFDEDLQVNSTIPDSLSMNKSAMSLDEYISSGFSKLSQGFENIESFFVSNIRQKIQSPRDCMKLTIKEENDDDELESQPATSTSNSVVWCPGVDFFPPDDINKPSKSGTANIVNLSGKFKLIHNHNFDAFLKSQNIPFLLRNAANQSRPIHTLTHDVTTNSLRIQVDGITKGDTTFSIGGPPGSSSIRHLKFEDHVSYVNDGTAVQVRKVAKNAPPNGATELIVKRTLANNGHNLLLFSKALFEDGSESVEAIQTFRRLDHPHGNGCDCEC